MQHIEYVCINYHYEAKITVERLTKTKLSEKQFEGTTFYCEEYLDEHGMRFYHIFYTGQVISWSSDGNKAFGSHIINCSVKILGEDSNYRHHYGFHKDDLKLPEPLWYLIGDYGAYQVVGPLHSHRNNYWSSIHRDCNGNLIPDEDDCNAQKTIATSVASSTPLLNHPPEKPGYVTTNSFLGNLMYICPAEPYNLHGSIINFITRESRSSRMRRFIFPLDRNTDDYGRQFTEESIWDRTVLGSVNVITDFVWRNAGLRILSLSERLNPRGLRQIKAIRSRLIKKKKIDSDVLDF